MMKLILSFLILVCAILLLPGSSGASHLSTVPTVEPPVSVNDILSRFRYFREFKKLDSAIPQVVEVELPGSSALKTDFVLVEDETTSLQPFEIVPKNVTIRKVPYTIQASDSSGNIASLALRDDNYETYTDFPIVRTGTEQATIKFIYARPVTLENISFIFDPNSGYPNTYSLTALEENINPVIIATETPFNGQIVFPKRLSSVWELKLKYTQPLRIMEIVLPEQASELIPTSVIRFLMRPGSPYLLFSQPDIYVNTPYLESGNLFSATDLKKLELPFEVSNPLYKPADDDVDGVINALDNCPDISNKDQADINKNAKGDACEDFDQDFILNSVDNCPDHPNALQQDSDGDKIGDHCDGAESRLTERLSFLPWLGIVLGFGVVISIFAITVRKPAAKNTTAKDKI